MEDNKKSIVTSYRLSQDTKDKIKDQLEDMGLTQQEYFNKVVSLMELENVKQNDIFAINTIELQELTSRINNLFIGLCEQGNSFLSNKAAELVELKSKYKDMLLNKDDSITQLKEGLQYVYADLSVAQNENEDHKEELLNIKDDYIKQLDQLEQSINDKNVIVEEYKSKNDMLLSDLKEHKQYKEELHEYKKLLANAQGKNIELGNSIKDKDNSISALHKDIESLKQEHKLDKNSALLDLKLEHQKAIEELNNKHNKAIADYQDKYKELLDKLEKKKVTSKPRATKDNQ